MVKYPSSGTIVVPLDDVVLEVTVVAAVINSRLGLKGFILAMVGLILLRRIQPKSLVWPNPESAGIDKKDEISSIFEVGLNQKP